MHIVDLDGAAGGEPCNLDIISNIATAVLIPTQLGGGIRTMETIEQLLKIGVERIILGTVAVENPKLVEEACYRFNNCIIVSIDARDGYIATHGWKQDTGIRTVEFARSMVKRGVRRFIHTDIKRDGTLTEPNFSAIAELIDSVEVPVVAAGGISSILHLKMLMQLGVEGSIVGKALYTGDINLREALDLVN